MLLFLQSKEEGWEEASGEDSSKISERRSCLHFRFQPGHPDRELLTIRKTRHRPAPSSNDQHHYKQVLYPVDIIKSHQDFLGTKPYEVIHS